MRNLLSKINYWSVFVLLALLGACNSDNAKTLAQDEGFVFSESNPELATGFTVKQKGDVRLIEIFNPWDALQPAQKIYLVDRNGEVTMPRGAKVIQTPLDKMVCLSATHLSFLDALDAIDNLVGVSSSDFVVSPKFQELVSSGQIREIGIADHFKLEELIALSPELIMVSPQKGQSFEPLINAGLTIVPNGDYLENHPLGRAEWIKFVGVLLGKEQQAISIFDSIKQKYYELQKLTQNISVRPTILAGKQYGGFWNLPGGQSYVAQFFEDAGVNYLWADNPERGGIMLDFETVYAKSLKADFWRFTTYSQQDFSYQMLEAEDIRYQDFDAFKNKKILVCNTLKTPYFQRGLLEPQIILGDFIHIFHPALLPEHQNKYYHLMP